ncbi:LYR motif-containing protein 1 [Lamellibrachia satsuma]|nr:LYR motif-containing protein 1 [Lamellibrachia satsuma]
MLLKHEVLTLYRRIQRLSRTWKAAIPAETNEERVYIRNEARQLFRQNKHLNDENEIRQCMREGQARIELALHYNIPYPRAVHIPQNVLPPGKRKLKDQVKYIQQSKPIYIKSYK